VRAGHATVGTAALADVRDLLARPLRGLLIRASHNEVKSGRPPLIEFDEFITIFEDGEDLAKSDWWLARDLVLIRVIEQLYKKGWLDENKELVPEDPSEEQPSEEI
jgi:CRISPR-associated protein Cst1